MEKSFGGRWFNQYEHCCKYDIAQSFVPPLSLNEFFTLTGVSKEEVMEALADMDLVYGERCGIAALREVISSMYETVAPDCVISTHAGVGANELVYSSLHSQGGETIVILPTYQQLKSFPEMIGTKVIEYSLEGKNNYAIDYDELRKLVNSQTKLITFCNPNNPYGKMFRRDELEKLADVAREAGCYVMCDEIYSGIGPELKEKQVSMCDVYEKGITTGSLSKTYSAPGLRIGWIASRDRELMAHIADVRHYHTMECSVITEYLAAKVLEQREKVIARNQAVIDANFTFFLSWIEEVPGLSFRKPDSGPILIVDYDFEADSVELCRSVVEETGVLLMPGHAFGLKQCFRIGLTAKAEVFAEALCVLAKYLKQYVAHHGLGRCEKNQ